MVPIKEEDVVGVDGSGRRLQTPVERADRRLVRIPGSFTGL